MAKTKRTFAFIALLLTAVLILPCFAGCSETPTEKDNPGMLTYDYDFIPGNMQSYYHSIHVTLTLSEGVEFECKSLGYPYLFDNSLLEKTIKSGETIALDVTHNKPSEEMPIQTSDGYFTIIARKENNIVGYIVLSLKIVNSQKDNPDFVDYWKLEVVKSVEFPQIDGEYQNITENYVQKQLKKITKS